MYPDQPRLRIAVCLTALVIGTSGCCSFGNRANQQNVIAARKLTSHGLNALYKGQAAQATRLLNQACEANPDDSRIRHHLANSLVAQGEVESAIRHLKLAIQQAPDDPALHVQLGNLYLQQGQSWAAREQSIEALNLNRQLAEAWLLRGRSERAAGNLDEAIDSLHRAEAYADEVPEIRLELAATWIDQGQPLRALTAMEIHNAAIAEDQLPMPAVELTGQALVDLKQFDRARRLLWDAHRRPGASPKVWILLSRAQLFSGDPSSARRTAMSAKHAFPDNPQVAAWLGQMTSFTDPAMQAAR